MAVDTAAKRNSALKFGLLHGLPLPNGSVDDAGRADALFLYRGFYDSAADPPDPTYRFISATGNDGAYASASTNTGRFGSSTANAGRYTSETTT